jgi:hypothetical protein
MFWILQTWFNALYACTFSPKTVERGNITEAGLTT